jgi:membrane fusion protein (multidrug efflux system)
MSETKRCASWTAAILMLLLMAFGCSAPESGRGGFTMPPTPVEVAEVISGPVVDRFESVGTIEAEKAITVVAEIDGAVVDLPFREGAPISRGGMIARIDGAQLEAELARAEALLAQKQSVYDRIKIVVDKSAGAPQDLDDAAAALKVAQADLALAIFRLDKTRITAPFGGILGARRISPGAYLRRGEAITDLARISEIRVNFSVPERFLGRLSRGAEVTVSTTAFPGYELTGEIIVVEPLLDPATRSARLVARVINPEGKFRPGMSANVSAVLGQRTEALTIPNEAVFVDGNQAYVFEILEDGVVTRRAVSLGTRLADAVEVIRGLEPGARVVRSGHQKLFEGAKVQTAGKRGMGGPPAAAHGEPAAEEAR